MKIFSIFLIIWQQISVKRDTVTEMIFHFGTVLHIILLNFKLFELEL